jgi:MoxR-like ATPase
MSRVIVGKQPTIELLLVALIADGHALIEDVPGMGKTLMAKSLAKSIGGEFKRVQFTPDLLPADITGFNVYNQQSGHFAYQSACSRAWRSDRSPWMAKPTFCRSPSS